MKQNFKRQAWMKRYQDAFLNELPCEAGRLCWNTASFHWNQGHDAAEAGKQAAESRRAEIHKAPLNTF